MTVNPRTPTCEICNQPKSQHNWLGNHTMICRSPPTDTRPRKFTRTPTKLTLAQLNQGTRMQQRHHAQRTITLLRAIDNLTAMWNGVFETTECVTELRRTANHLQTLAAAIETNAQRNRKQPGKDEPQ